MVDENADARQGVGTVLRQHPILVAVFVVCIALGAVLGMLYLPADWPAFRRIAGGVFAGAGVAVFLTVTRLFD